MGVRQITFFVALGLLWPGFAKDALSATVLSTPLSMQRDSVQVRPEPVLIPNPGYVKAAFQAGTEGLAAVVVIVDASGEVASARVARSSLNRDLDAAAVSAARRARFTPALRDGRAVPARLELQYFFTRNGPIFYTTVTVPSVGTKNIGALPEPVKVPDPAVCDSVAWLRLPATVTVTARVDSLGSVIGADVASSSGNQLVDRKAREFALKAKFRPGTAYGRPAIAAVKIEYEFHQFRTYVSRRRVLPADSAGDEIAPTAQQP
jgi:TonB family protein